MRKFTALTIAFLGLSILACSGGSDDEGTKSEPEAPQEEVKSDLDAKGAKLNQPWKEMNLPVGDGEVLVDTSSMLLIGWDGGSITALTQDFKARIGDAGYKVSEELVSGSQGSVNTAIVYQKDKGYVGLLTGEEDGVTYVYMEDLGETVADDSTIKDPDKRGGIARDARSRKGGKKSGRSSGSKGGGGKGGGQRGGRSGGKGGKGGRGGH